MMPRPTIPTVLSMLAYSQPLFFIDGQRWPRLN
jgi:hypothetical protein